MTTITGLAVAVTVAVTVAVLSASLLLLPLGVLVFLLLLFLPVFILLPVFLAHARALEQRLGLLDAHPSLRCRGCIRTPVRIAAALTRLYCIELAFAIVGRHLRRIGVG